MSADDRWGACIVTAVDPGDEYFKFLESVPSMPEVPLPEPTDNLALKAIQGRVNNLFTQVLRLRRCIRALT